MGVINQASNLIDRVIRLERKVNEIWTKIGLASAVIRKGGLTLLQDAFFRMVDDQGIEILYAGPDSEGRQVVMLRREGGAPILYSYFTATGQQYWALTDRTENQILSDDAESGLGMARPYMSIPTRTVRWDALPNTDGSSFESVVDTGWVVKQQPYWTAQVVTCSTDSATTGEARLLLDNVQVGPVFPVGFAVDFRDTGKFPIPGSHMSQHRLVLECRRTAGTGRIGADMAVRGEQS